MVETHNQENDKNEENNQRKLKTLTEVFDEQIDNWPTESLKRNLERLKPEEEAEVYLKLNPGDYNLTEEATDIERQFRPIITIRTRELQTELKRWKIGGGAFFRVIGDAPDLESAYKLCLQYFIIWTRQLFPFQFIFLSMPFFITSLFLWRFSAVYPAGPGVSWDKYAALLISGLLFIILGTWTYFEGLYRRFIQGIKNWKVIPDSMIGFVIPGILLWTAALEYAITDLANATGFIALIPFSSWFSLLLGVIILIIASDFYIRGEKSFVERFSHPMDYAPLFIFLGKNVTENWQIEGAQFDFFHYRTDFIPKVKLTFHKTDEEKKNPWFLIDRSWHAFREYIKPNLLLRIFSNVVVNIILWILFAIYYTIIILTQIFGVDLGALTTLTTNETFLFFSQFISYIIIPMIAVLMIWSINRTREYKLDLWEDMQSKTKEELLKQHHLSLDRLRIFWNLRNKEHIGDQRITSLWSKSTWIEGDKSRLVTRVKLQYPFDRYKDWKTLRDTQEELLSLISLQLKERELEDIQKEIEDAKIKLFKYRRPFIKDKIRREKEQALKEESQEDQPV